MRKKILTYCYIAAFLLMLLIPGLGMLLFGEAQAAANEVLASRPSLTNRDGSFNTHVLTDFSDYMADRFALRQEFVTAWAWLNARLLNSSVEEQVILGSDGWLYYAATEADYMGRGLSDGQLRSAARNLALMAEYAQSQGAELIFTIAPNKNSLYPGHMPDYIPRDPAASNAARLPNCLAAEGLHYGDLFAPFRAREEILYYRSDSHWTKRGAALAADTLLAAMGRETGYFAAYAGVDFALRAQAAPHRGDLYEMLYPAGKGMEADFALPLDYATQGDPNGGDAIRIRTESDGEGTLLCFRDSFGRDLYPYLAEAFGQALFSRQADYDLTQIAALEADTVLIELVERNIPWLLSKSPVFPAPERADVPKAAAGSEIAAVRAVKGSTADTAELVRVCGLLPEGTEAGAPVYIGRGGLWYEALVTMDADGAMGFAAWLPAGEGAYELMSLRDGWTLFPCAVEK